MTRLVAIDMEDSATLLSSINYLVTLEKQYAAIAAQDPLVGDRTMFDSLVAVDAIAVRNARIKSLTAERPTAITPFGIRMVDKESVMSILVYCVSQAREQYELMHDQPTNTPAVFNNVGASAAPSLFRQNASWSEANTAFIPYIKTEDDENDDDVKPSRQVGDSRG